MSSMAVAGTVCGSASGSTFGSANGSNDRATLWHVAVDMALDAQSLMLAAEVIDIPSNGSPFSVCSICNGGMPTIFLALLIRDADLTIC